jgi:hypothetical protein
VGIDDVTEDYRGAGLWIEPMPASNRNGNDKPARRRYRERLR